MYFRGYKGRRDLVCDSSHKKVRKAKIIMRQNSVERKLHSPKSFGANTLLSSQDSFPCSFVHNHTGTVERTAWSTELWKWTALSKIKMAEQV